MYSDWRSKVRTKTIKKYEKTPVIFGRNSRVTTAALYSDKSNRETAWNKESNAHLIESHPTYVFNILAQDGWDLGNTNFHRRYTWTVTEKVTFFTVGIRPDEPLAGHKEQTVGRNFCLPPQFEIDGLELY